MELAISTYSLSRWRRDRGKTLEQAIDWIASSGVKAIEFAAHSPNLDGPASADAARRAKALRKRCEKNGLRVAGYCVAAELLGSAEDQKKAVEQLKRDVDVAVALGAPSMRHDVTRGPKNAATLANKSAKPMSLPQVIASLVPPIREVTHYAEQRGVKTSLENHGFYMQPAETVEKLLNAVNESNFGLTMDVGNFLVVDQDPVAAVQRLAKHAIMVHAKDFHQRPKDRVPPSGWFATPASYALRGAIAGHGVLDLPRQLRILKNAGYDGYLSLEFEGIEEPTQAIALGLEYLRRELAALDASPKKARSRKA